MEVILRMVESDRAWGRGWSAHGGVLQVGLYPCAPPWWKLTRDKSWGRYLRGKVGNLYDQPGRDSGLSTLTGAPPLTTSHERSRAVNSDHVTLNTGNQSHVLTILCTNEQFTNNGPHCTWTHFRTGVAPILRHTQTGFNHKIPSTSDAVREHVTALMGRVPPSFQKGKFNSNTVTHHTLNHSTEPDIHAWRGWKYKGDHTLNQSGQRRSTLERFSGPLGNTGGFCWMVL